MEDKARILGDDDHCIKSPEDACERGVPISRPQGETAAGDNKISASRQKVSSSSDVLINADRKLVHDVLKRYTEAVEARNLAAVMGEKKRSAQSLTANAQLLESDADSNRKRQKLANIADPLDPDVLFGRRDAQRFHPGNILLRALCDTYRDEYENGDREVKTVVKNRILDEISSKGGRFLKRSAGEITWYCVDEEVALEKIAFTMRDTREKKKSVQI